jgi:hypothetical protein
VERVAQGPLFKLSNGLIPSSKPQSSINHLPIWRSMMDARLFLLTLEELWPLPTKEEFDLEREKEIARREAGIREDQPELVWG